jgi:hypothetical protein
VSNIIPIRRPVKRRCIGCGVRLDPSQPPHHYACAACFRHDRFRRAVERFRRWP